MLNTSLVNKSMVFTSKVNTNKVNPSMGNLKRHCFGNLQLKSERSTGVFLFTLKKFWAKKFSAINPAMVATLYGLKWLQRLQQIVNKWYKTVTIVWVKLRTLKNQAHQRPLTTIQQRLLYDNFQDRQVIKLHRWH